MPIKVLIVDSSPFIREAIKTIFSGDSEIEVVGEAQNGKEAVAKITELSPDVVTMNIWMPVMNGIQAIKEIMSRCPVPIVVVSSRQPEVAIKALTLGAMDYVEIPCVLNAMSDELLEKVHLVSKVKALRRIDFKKLSQAGQTDVFRSNVDTDSVLKLVVIGVSTGGPQALRILLSSFTEALPCAVIVVQHIADGFIEGMVNWLTQFTQLPLSVASHGEPLKVSCVYFAPSRRHLRIDEDKAVVLSAEARNGEIYVPSIDVTMSSAADRFRKNAIGVIMTGMGTDGIEGIKRIKDCGGITLAQDEDSSAMYGMNKMAIESGSVDKVLSLKGIAEEIINIVNIPGGMN